MRLQELFEHREPLKKVTIIVGKINGKMVRKKIEMKPPGEKNVTDQQH